MSGSFHGPLLDLRHPPSAAHVHEPPKKSGSWLKQFKRPQDISFPWNSKIKTDGEITKKINRQTSSQWYQVVYSGIWFLAPANLEVVYN